MLRVLFLIAFLAAMFGSARAGESAAARILSVSEKALVGRWQGNEQRFKNGWKQMDFYLFMGDGSYAVLILIFDPEKKEWTSPKAIDPDEGGNFEGEFHVVEGRVLVLNHWFASRQLTFEAKADELSLQRPSLGASWTMKRTKRFDWETPEMTEKIDAAISPEPDQTPQTTTGSSAPDRV